ncbi:MAG: SDR family NAD(P)-dependent oxidoreductase, partial [Nevskiaceae bacterium]
MKGLDGKRFIIAGGATGIGAATVERLVSEGAHVAIGDINASSARATAERMNEAGGSTFAVEFDFADESSIRDLIKKSVSLLGGVDGIFNVGADLSQETMSRDLDILSMDVAVW